MAISMIPLGVLASAEHRKLARELRIGLQEKYGKNFTVFKIGICHKSQSVRAYCYPNDCEDLLFKVRKPIGSGRLEDDYAMRMIAMRAVNGLCSLLEEQGVDFYLQFLDTVDEWQYVQDPDLSIEEAVQACGRKELQYLLVTDAMDWQTEILRYGFKSQSVPIRLKIMVLAEEDFVVCRKKMENDPEFSERQVGPLATAHFEMEL